MDLSKVEEQFKSNEGYWFVYTDDKDIQIKVRPLFPEKATEFTKQSMKVNAGTKELDQEKLARLTRNYIIADWKGITIGDNNECTNDAKEILANYCADLIAFVLSKSREVAKIISTQNEEELKNLKTLLGQS